MSLRLHRVRMIKRNNRIAEHERSSRFGLWQVNKLEPLKTKTFTVGSAHMKLPTPIYGSGTTFGVSIRKRHQAKIPLEVKIPEMKVFDVSAVISTINEAQNSASSKFEEQKRVFESKLPELLADSRNLNKYVAIVDGKIAGSDTDKIRLAMSIYEKKGNIPMFVGKVTKKPEVYLDTMDV